MWPALQACKVFDASRATAFQLELIVLTAIASAHMPGLPKLEAYSSAELLLLTRPVAERLGK